MANALQAAIGYLGGREIVNAVDNMTLLEARIRSSTETLEEFNFSYEELLNTAKDTGSEFASSVEIFQRISFVRDELKSTASEMTLCTDNVSKLGVVSGAGTQALNAGLKQLGQSLSAEIVRAEEYNSIMENIPVVGRAIADELGVTTGGMRQLVIEGELLSRDVFAAILNQTDEINAEFDKFPVTIGRAFSSFKIDLQQSAQELDGVISGTQILVKGFEIAGNALSALVSLIKGFASTTQALFSFVIAGVIDAFNEGMRLVESGVNTIIGAINRIKSEQIPLIEISSNISRGDLAQAALDSASQDIADAKEGFKKAFDDSLILVGLQEEADKTKPKVQGVAREISQEYADIVEEIKNKNNDAGKEAKKLADRIFGVTDQLRFNIDQLKRSNEEQEVYNNLRSAGVAIDTVAGQEISKLTIEHAGLEAQLQREQRIANDTADAFGRFFEDGITGAESFGDALGNLAGELADLVLQLTVIEPLKNSITNGLTGSNSSGGGISLGNVGSSIAGIFGFDSGGSMLLGGNGGIDNNVLSLNGSPIAKTSRGETLSISPKSDSSGGSVVIHQTLNVSTGVQETVRAEMVDMLPEIQESARAAVQEAQLRGIQ